MRRPRRNSARVLALAIAGALLFVVGYFAGSRYAGAPLDDVTAVVLETPPLVEPAGVALRGGWHLVAVGRADTPACRQLLVRLVSAHNRLAHRPELQQRLQVLFLDAARAEATGQSMVAAIAPAAARSFARQLGRTEDALLDCRDAPLALLDPQARLRALLPGASDPAAVAQDLERLLDHFDG